MKFNYQLSNQQNLEYPAFFVHHVDRKPRLINNREVMKAVEQLNAGADIVVSVTDDQVAVSMLIFALTSRTVRVSVWDKSIPTYQRTIPGHLFIFFPGMDLATKIW